MKNWILVIYFYIFYKSYFIWLSLNWVMRGAGRYMHKTTLLVLARTDPHGLEHWPYEFWVLFQDRIHFLSKKRIRDSWGINILKEPIKPTFYSSRQLETKPMVLWTCCSLPDVWYLLTMEKPSTLCFGNEIPGVLTHFLDQFMGSSQTLVCILCIYWERCFLLLF